MRTRAKAADATAVDLPYLSTTYDVPETDLQSILDAPTTDLIHQFLASLIAKGHDFDALRADKLKVDVELENTVRTSESKIRAQKGQVTKHAKEVEELREKLSEAEGARESLASELEVLQSSTSGSNAETSSLKQRIETLEAANREALALVEGKSGEKDGLATELSEQHGKLLNLRREVGQLEERNQSLENAASTQKFREQSLQQEIDLLKRNNEWHGNELETRNKEHAKFRKERNVRIASLQHELEDSNATVDTLRRSETTLRQRLEELQAKADEAYARIAGLQEETARKEQDFRTEVDATKRLAELQAQNAATHKARLQDVQGQVDQIKEDAADEIGRLQAEIETERGDKEQAERKIAELELSVERLEQMPRASRPGTPRRSGGFDPQTPSRLGSRAGSPSAMPGSLRKTVNGLSFTQVYSQMTEAQEELAHEQRRTKKLSDTLEDMVRELEQRGPELAEVRQDQERLEQEVLNFSTMLDEAVQTRENAVKEAERWQNEAAAAAREGDVLRQQLRDLSTQIKILMVEMESRDQGLGEMSAQERVELERAARGELADGDLDRMTDTGRFIAERLVVFRNVSDLQEKNQQMLRLVETLGDQLEGEEAQEKERQTAAYASENQELKQKVQRLQDELQATVTQIDSYMKERDMFRRMLQHRGQLPAGDSEVQSMFGQSVPPATPSRKNGAMEPPTPRSKDVADLNKLLREQQTFFDQYRNESATDRRMLKEQVDGLAREKSAFQADVARMQSQLELASGRYEMLQGNMNGIRGENQELQKRSQQLAEQAAKQDLRTQQVAEDLVEAKSLSDSLRNENANARAEKDLWRRIETRLTQDNQSLMDERSRLNKHVADLQNLQNERELADSESRRRLQTRTETLEAELVDVKKKLEREVDDSRKASLRREYEEGQNRTRIDDLVKSLGSIREELVAAKTTRDQLAARVDEMKIELRSAEEKVVALQPRPTPRSTSATQNGDGEAHSEELSAEQHLAIEVSDLRRDLEFAKNELEGAREQAEQYKSISQATEEELASINMTSVQYQEDMDQQLAEKDAKIHQLEQRVEDITAELTTTNNEMSELRTKAEEVTRALDEQKEASESELARLRDDADRHGEEKKLMREDLKAQSEIAQQAQQSYEDELLKHAEAAKQLQQVRRDHNELRTEVAGIRAEAEAAKAGLESGRESWEEQKGRFERELEDVKKRREDVDAQNKLLHQQMESFSSELAALRQGRALPAGPNDGEETAAGSPGRTGGDAKLQEVIRYLRREKEIVDVQYELSMQEAKRLQQQLDYAKGQLESTRQSLAEERRKGGEKEATESSTNRLQQTINELNLYRESATTLRNEARVAREKLEERVQEVERLGAQIEPLQVRVGELEGEMEGKDGELKLLQSDRDHWRERTQNIISKYDRVDPAELESIKSQLEAAKAEKERLEGIVSTMREHADGEAGRIEEITKAKDAGLSRFKEQAKEQNRKQNDSKREVVAERERVVAELNETKAELENLKVQLVEAESKTGGAEEGEVEEEAELQRKFEEAEGRTSEHVARAGELQGQVEGLQRRVAELEGTVEELQGQLESAQQQQATGQVPPESVESGELLEKLRQDLATAQQEAEALRTAAAQAPPATQQDSTMTDTTTTAVDGEEKSTAQQIQEACHTLRAEMQSQHELALKQKDDYVQGRLESMRTQLNTKLREGRDKAKQDVLDEHTAEVQKLREEHEKAVEELKGAHAAELERLKQDGEAAVQRASANATNAPPAAVVNEKAADAAPQAVKVDDDADLSSLEISESQVAKLFQTNSRAKTILLNNISKGVKRDTAKLEETIAEKDAEIGKLQTELAAAEAAKAEAEIKNAEAPPATHVDTSKNDEVITELKSKLEAAQKDKEVAVAIVTRNLELKAKVQVSQLDALRAKWKVVQEAAKNTPEKVVKEVFEVADKTKPAPKVAPAPAPAPAASAGAGGAQSPAIAKPATVVPPSPAQAPTAQNATDVKPLVDEKAAEEAKKQARLDRFGSAAGTPAASSTTSTSGQPSTGPIIAGTFGQPSFASGSFGQPSTPAGLSFGQPSAPTGPALAQPARRPSGPNSSPFAAAAAGSPNPQAASFTPSDVPTQPRKDLGTGPAALRGLHSGIPRGGAGSGLPRAGGAAGARGGAAAGGNSIAIQGAAARGGAQTGLPRGGANAGRGGGRGGQADGSGIARRGGANGAGQKRPHDGDGSAGDGKRNRGGAGG
ncbi:Protein mlp1 [Recurvomyces mirabilis]|uniref:Protein mlp1 n=1 Tax=Recurvomyces mirabilis TaxID=574656 RepID=A0AAE0WQA7_9PEZI|nr:Protein mlp1 [Recurvomyces mirabilis]KAK5153707.1 Protein mlp1 [Recurvomyces mirabilis]